MKKIKVSRKLLLELSKDDNVKEILKKEVPQLFETPTDITEIVEKYGKDKAIELINNAK